MKKSIRKLLVILINLLGVFMMLYLGGYWLLFRPARDLYWCYIDNAWTLKRLFLDLLKIFLASTAVGAIWCIFDILASFFRDE